MGRGRDYQGQEKLQSILTCISYNHIDGMEEMALGPAAFKQFRSSQAELSPQLCNRCSRACRAVRALCPN